MPKTYSVIAPKGKVCPKAGGKAVAGVIDDKTAVTVPDNVYYRKMLKEGSLLDATAAVEAAVTEEKPVTNKGRK